MNRKLYIFVAGLVLVLGASFGCVSGERPFSSVEVCLGNEKNLSLFTDLMRSIAQTEKMKFVEGSAQTQKELESIGKTIHEVKPTGKVVNLGVEREDGMGLTAGNLGLPKYQVAIGFSEGANSREAHEFADRVIGKLRSRWPVEIVTSGRGAQGMKNCKG